MPDELIHADPVLLSLFILFGFSFLVQMVYYWGIFLKVGKRHKLRGMRHKASGIREEVSPTIDNQQSTIDNPPGVSVVICAHNEFHHLSNSLPQFLEQDYLLYEVVVVDHASDDDTPLLLADLADRYKHLKVITIQRDLNFFSGKKFPLSIGIKSASYELILLTDADCRPAGNQWVRLMQEAFSDDKEIVLGYGAYEKRKGILNALIRYDTLQVAIQYLSFAMAGMPYMGVGRNLAYRKRLFYQQKGFISHYRIASGDDDLFINQVAHRKNTGVQINPGAFTYSEPKTSAGKWFTQKRRHLTTSSHYRFLHKILLGLYSAAQLAFWILLTLLLIWKFAWIVVLSVLLLKWVSQYIVFGRCMKQLQEKQLIPWIPLLDWMILLIQVLIAGTNLITRPQKWK
ncbi:MAG: glycosyltransferase [Bacteroidales bacterium]|nr:glycosyltransferase [Bacteroidales bacterium]